MFRYAFWCRYVVFCKFGLCTQILLSAPVSAQALGTIEGHVVLPNGEFSYGATVLLTQLGRTSETDLDGRYRFDRFGVRGLFANNWVSQAGQLNTALERQTGVNPNVASQMRGYYLEPEVHIFPRQWRQDMAFFIRYEKFNTQHKMPLGFVPLPQFNRSAWVLGTTYRPVPDVAVKFDYIFNQNASQVVTPRDSINLGLGWWF